MRIILARLSASEKYLGEGSRANRPRLSQPIMAKLLLRRVQIGGPRLPSLGHTILRLYRTISRDWLPYLDLERRDVPINLCMEAVDYLGALRTARLIHSRFDMVDEPHTKLEEDLSVNKPVFWNAGRRMGSKLTLDIPPLTTNDELLTMPPIFGSVDMIEQILLKVANINAISTFFGTPLRAAASQGNHAAAKVLLSRGAHVNHSDDSFGPVKEFCFSNRVVG